VVPEFNQVGFYYSIIKFLLSHLRGKSFLLFCFNLFCSTLFSIVLLCSILYCIALYCFFEILIFFIMFYRSFYDTEEF
jgi:hypothetical protein